MSNRVFKKVYGGKDDLPGQADSEDEHPVAFTNAKSIPNAYQLLNDLSESEAKEDDGRQDGGNSADSSKMEDETSQATKKKRRKKRPAKKKKTAPGSGTGSDRALDTEMEDEEAAKQKQKVTRPAAKRYDEGHSSNASRAAAAFEAMFKMDSKFVNSEFELKKIFGAKVVNYERNKQGQRRIFRHSKLVMPKEQWPSVSGSGISMSYLNTIDGGMYFKFEHNQHYQEVQRQFLRAVDTLNPDNIVSILRSHPYHIDSHIQLSDMAKAAEDMSVAADLVEGAVHCLENSFHVRFTITNPSCRLEYKFQENRPFFILLFKHLVFVGSRACHRTALELCKRLLCLDPVADPLCVSLMIDFYAIKAGELRWFVDLYHYWEKPRNLDQLPNFAYSSALAYHLLSLKDTDRAQEYSAKSDTLIQYALLMFPSIMLPLLDKLSVQVDARAKHHNYFNGYAQNHQSRALRLLCELYVWRTHHVWREPSVLGWLERNVKIVLDKVDAREPVVRDFELKRSRRYGATPPRNILRHVILTDNSELTVNLPLELSKEPILNFDPLPPPDAVDIYQIKDFRRQVQQGAGGGNIINLLLNSLWRDVNAPMPNENLMDMRVEHADPAAAPAEPGGGAAEDTRIALGAGLQQSVTALLDAMRDLLTNANGRPDGDEAADGEDSATDADQLD